MVRTRSLPCNIGEGAIIGAGSVAPHDMPGMPTYENLCRVIRPAR
ncbi:hypothetical protein [Porphyromonas gulae]|nr:hypothetical protein [Porphyromonas gulae]